MRSRTAGVPKLDGLSRRRHASLRPTPGASSRPAQTPRRGSDTAVAHRRPALPEARLRGRREKGRREAMRSLAPGRGPGLRPARAAAQSCPPGARSVRLKLREDHRPESGGLGGSGLWPRSRTGAAPRGESEGGDQQRGVSRPQTESFGGLSPWGRAVGRAWRADFLRRSWVGARWLGLRGLVSAAGELEAGQGPGAGVLTPVLCCPSRTGTTPTAGQL